MDTFNTPLPQEKVGDYIKRLRVELKMSQNQLADSAGIHLHSLGKIERGITTRLSYKTRRGLARALSIDLLQKSFYGMIKNLLFNLSKHEIFPSP